MGNEVKNSIKDAEHELKEKVEENTLSQYDFTEDWPILYRENVRIHEAIEALEEYRKINSAFDKHFIYKLGLNANRFKSEKLQYLNNIQTNTKKKYPFLADPDSKSPLLQLIYNKLWSADSLVYCTDNEGIVHGDTMNSLQTSLNEYFSDKSGNRALGFCLNELLRDRTSGEIKCREPQADEKMLVESIKNNHTLGNFMPVPLGCNAPRGTGVLKDYWDLTLLCIYDFYCSCCLATQRLEAIVGKEKVEIFGEWLTEGFGNWNSFVKNNYMQPFVTIKTNDGNYEDPISDEISLEELKNCEEFGKPVEFWYEHFSHFYEGKPLPSSKDECISFFCCTNRRIEKRGKLMADDLLTSKY